MFQNVFFGSATGMALYFGIKFTLLCLAWFGKLGWSGFTPLALAIHLVMDFAIFLNLAPLIGAGVLGGLGGLTPQTQSTIGSGAASAVNGFIRFSMGVSFAVTLMIISLIPFDYMFEMGNFLFVGLLLLAWGQYGLTFGGGEKWAQKISLGLMVFFSAIAIGVMMSPTVSKVVTGRAFWSYNKEVTRTEIALDKKDAEYNEAAVSRVLKTVQGNGIRNEKALESFVGKGFSQEDLDIYRAERKRGDDLTVPGAVKNGVVKSREWISESSWQEIAIVAGIVLGVLLIWKMMKGGGAPATTWKFPWRTILVLAALGLGTALLFYPTRSWIMEQIGNAKVGEMISGGERSISFAMTSLEPHRVCGLKRNTLYRLEGIKTSEGNKIPVTDRGNGSPFNSVPIGMTGGLEPDCPIQDRLYVWGILAGGKRIGEKFPTDAGGCTSVALNIGRVQKEGFILKERIGVELFLRE